MISGATSGFPNVSQGLQMYDTNIPQEGVIPSSLEQQTSTWESHSNSLLYTLSLLKEKVHQVESLVTIFISPNQAQPAKSTAIAIASMGALVQEVMVTASSLMFTCQQMSAGSSPAINNPSAANEVLHRAGATSSQPNIGGREERSGQGFYNPGESTLDHWYACDLNNNTSDQTNINVSNRNEAGRREKERESTKSGHENNEGSPKNYDIIELDAADLLAKYTHYCQVCGKGFKRDANLRMHMRAHGDEYKSSAALSNPMKNINNNITGVGCDDGDKDGTMMLPRKYSCPHEGCRWNRKHAKFQPLKSMICVKNHYKRSHCPKMYVCKRCNRKQFSVLSDLRTHEKHCGDLKWVCSCGTTFSRKDKLIGHCALFVGHAPATPPACGTTTTTKVMGKVEQQQQQRDQVQIRVNNR
ncbi:hypothetical protein RHGRI_036598 [Rhododendron griersonianum]|uniref:C2H2-type domain-containing protein n=1 Tax=Rhododendron griersonianum TaxID=479676 RepID=A0AAV6HSF6_9ERIC|nr:hypothetical protein RHGRI_036598 [Rhododendron griersonianum]